VHRARDSPTDAISRVGPLKRQTLAIPVAFPWSQNLDRVGRHPDVDLLESRFQPLLEFEEELAMFGLVGDIHEDPDQVR
jgi:hypothetical protein